MKFPNHIKFISTKSWNHEQWLSFRSQGIGGSEVSILFGLNPYQSKLQLHLQKSGLWDLPFEENWYSYRGKNLEDMIVSKYWKYYTDTPESVLINKDNPDYVPFKCSNPVGYFVNQKYPHLFASPDRILHIGHINRITGEPIKKPGILEVKNTASAESRKYESGCSPSFLAQTQMYMMLLEVDYAEIILLKDSTFPEVLAFERNDIFCNAIIETSKDFWDNVLEVRELLKQPKTDELEYALMQREPEPENSTAYLDFVKERYRGNENGLTTDGTPEQYKVAQDLLKLNMEKDKLEKDILAEEIKLKQPMLQQNIEQFNFMDGQYVRYKKDARNSFRWTNKVKLNIEL